MFLILQPLFQTLPCMTFTPFCSCSSLPFVLSSSLLGCKPRLRRYQLYHHQPASLDWLYLTQLHEKLPFRLPVDLSLAFLLFLSLLVLFSKGLLGCKSGFFAE